MAKINIMNRGTRKNPSWQYRFEIASVDGKRKFKSKSGFATKEEAEKAGTKALAEYENAGKVEEPSEMSCADFFDLWLKNYVLVNLASNTYSSYRRICDNILKPKIGLYRLKSLDVLTLQNTINEIFNENDYAKGYMNNILKVLKGSFSYACYTCKLIPYNIAEPVKIPKQAREKKDVDILTKEQMNAVLDRFSNAQHVYYPMMIGYYTGMRVGEVYGLTWDDIDLIDGYITVNKQVKTKEIKALNKKVDSKYTKLYIGKTKTPTSNRKIKIGTSLINLLSELKEMQEKQKEEYKEYYYKHYLKDERMPNGDIEQLIISMQECNGTLDLPTADFVCVKECGDYTGTTPMKYVGKVAREELGLQDFYFHMIRHTHATVLVSSSSELQIKDISERLGHASIRTTMDTYVKNTDEMRTKTMETFERIGKLETKYKNKELYNYWVDLKHRFHEGSLYKKNGIKFYEPWNDYNEFELWSMQNGYEEDMHIIRVDKTKDFHPDNCMWVSKNYDIRGSHVWTDGKNIKSYSLKMIKDSWTYRISTYDESGKRKEITKSGFKTEEDAIISAEQRIKELFESNKMIFKRVK